MTDLETTVSESENPEAVFMKAAFMKASSYNPISAVTRTATEPSKLTQKAPGSPSTAAEV
jgi:hypothetical protein